MSIVYFMRRGDRLLMCDRPLHIDWNSQEELAIGHPRFSLEAKGRLENDIEKMMGPMEEGKPYKMVLKSWPIE